MSYRQGKTALALTRVWHRTSCEDRILGRMATRIAHVLIGKHKPTFDPSVDAGDYVIVEHALKVKLSGKQWTDKKYFKHTGYPGGEKWIPITRIREQDPGDIIRRAVSGMLPKNSHRKTRLARLRVFPGAAPESELKKVLTTWRDPEVQALRASVDTIPHLPRVEAPKTDAIERR